MLTRRDRSRLLAISESVHLKQGAMLCEPGHSARYVYFPNDCIVSLLAATDSPSGLGIGMVGREGMLGAQLVLGVRAAPLHALVQGSGTALRIEAALFCRELGVGKSLQRMLNHYLYAHMAQLATSVACAHAHVIGQRLSRWLLMTQDRARPEALPLTHEFLARMLGVRRVGVTGAATDLQQRGLIRYNRGKITVLDRRGLEANACRCYAVDRDIYASFAPGGGRRQPSSPR